jgi:hypothetical protein
MLFTFTSNRKYVHVEQEVLASSCDRHCEERSDEAIQGRGDDSGGTSLDCFASLAMTGARGWLAAERRRD